MGGLGSGRWGWHRPKPLADDCLGLDVNWLHRKGMLRPGRWASVSWVQGEKTVGTIDVTAWDGLLRLRYRWQEGDGPWKDEDYWVPIEWTPCHFGGKRPWFRCVGPGCGRRVGKLYLRHGLFLCRHCHGLAYESQRKGKGERLLRRAQKIRERLGGKPGFLTPFPPKPKGMRWETYYRLWDQARDLEIEGSQLVLQSVGRSVRRACGVLGGLTKGQDV